MQRCLFKIGGTVLTALLSACATPPDSAHPPLVVVPYVDYNRYMGTWYEIARFPHSFEEGCVAATATYRMMDDGEHIEVINRCHEKTVDGPLREARAKAWVEDPPIQAKLKVQFFWPFVGDYWIVDLADDYRYAVVTAPERDYLWILSRTPTMDPSDYERILSHLRLQGLDLTQLKRPPQIP